MPHCIKCNSATASADPAAHVARAGSDQHAYLSALRHTRARIDAHQRLHLLLRLRPLRRAIAAEIRRLLRILLVRLGAVSAGTDRGLRMRNAAMLNERDALAIWYGGVAPTLSLRAWSAVYGALSALRRGLYAAHVLRRRRVTVPVIVVGNLTAGGTGKTPLVIALVEALRARGWKPGVISRGYGGSTEQTRRVDASCDPALVGDEARLIFDTTQAPVCVGRDRVAAARELIASATVDVLIADDGLQHYRLARDVEICVIDGLRRFGNARLLPAGPLREPLSRIDAVDFRVCNGGIPQAGETLMTLAGDLLVSLHDARQRQPLGALRGQRAHAVAGIGNPARFFALLRAAGVDVIEHAFGDHHRFAAHDFAFDDALPVIMTAKDAVKCRAFATPRDWYLPVRAQLPAEFFDAVAVRLRK
jgi:tetraacyldisaccharide 4'-kinase